MSFIFGNDFFVIPLFGIAIFVFVYMNIDRFLNFMHKRTLGQREELFVLLDKMYVRTDRQRASTMIFLASFGLGALFFLALWPHVIPGIMMGLAVSIAGFTVPKSILQSMWETRCTRVVDQMVDGMTIMANGVRAGLSVTQAMERVVENIGGPLGQEFQVALNQIQLGRSVEEALNEFGTRIPRADVQMFVTGVNILKETGGDMGETFTTIASTIRERQKIEKKIDALTAKGKTQAIFATMVPFVLLLLFLAVDSTYVMPLFTTPLGWFSLFLMVGLQVLGGLMMKKIVTIKV